MGLGIVKRDQHDRFQGYECPYCFSNGEYSQAWDSFVCVNCNIWLDDACTHKAEDGCPFYGRPETPVYFETPFGKGVV